MSIIKQKKTQTNTLEQSIKSVSDAMLNFTPDSKEYTEMAKNLKTLCEAQKALCEAQSKENDHKIKLDTVITVAGSLLGIVIIVGYEHLHVVVSKALGFVVKGRV